MKFLSIIALACAAYAAPSLACNAHGVDVSAHQLKDAMAQFAAYAQQDFSFSWAVSDATQVSSLADHIGDTGRAGNCYEATNDFNNELNPIYVRLDSQVDPRIGSTPNYYLRTAWSNVEDAYRNLQAAINAGGPGPGPGPDACYGLAGYYQGTCRANAGQSAISFQVYAQGGACVVTNSPYFQPAYLRVFGSQGDADVAQIPGGVAIQNTHLTVWGNGRFQLTGYNYAGHFNFLCN